MINSKNSTVRELITHFITAESSVFAENYRYDISVPGTEAFMIL